MIDLVEALQWLNQSPTDQAVDHLSVRIRQVMIELRQEELLPDDQLTLMNRAIVFSQGSLDPLEYPEVLCNCAVVAFQSGLICQSRDCLVEACYQYRELDDTFRLAVASWMRGIVEWEVKDKMTAHSLYLACRNTLLSTIAQDQALLAMNQVDESEQEKARKRIRTYQSWIDNIDAHLVELADEVYTWLNGLPSEKMKLSPESIEQRSKIIQAFQQAEIDQAAQWVDELETKAKLMFNHTETPEILVFTGIIQLHLNNFNKALQDLKQSVEMFTPKSHKQCVARWILGIAQWENADMRMKAITNWENAIHGFQHLQELADFQDNTHARLWYSSKIPAMEKALRSHIQS